MTATTDAPKGSLTTAKISFTIDANDQITDAEQFNDVIVSYRNGAPVRVRDVGRAVAAATDRFSAAYYNNEPAILLSVYKQPGANVIDTVERIKTLLPKVTAVIPPAIKIDTVLDRTTTIRASVRDVEFTLLLTVVLVVLVVLAIPARHLGDARAGPHHCAVAARRICGDVCVRLQSRQSVADGAHDRHRLRGRRCHRRSRERLPPYRGTARRRSQAALVGSAEIRFTVLSISASLIAVFIPLLLMGGIVGRLFREFAVTVMAAVAVSAFVSLSLAPMLCARFLRPQRVEEHGRLYLAIECGFDAMLAGYRRTLDIVLRHQRDHARGIFRDLGADHRLWPSKFPKGSFRSRTPE